MGVNLLVIDLERFSGKPVGGLAWAGQKLPFGLIEVGISESGRKTRGRTIQWLTRGTGGVYSTVARLLKSRSVLD